MSDTDRLQTALALLRANARPEALESLERFGIVGDGRLGLSVPAMRGVARTLGRDHTLAQALWDTGIPDARIVASMVAEPALLTSRQMDAWVKGFAAWDVCDQTCLNAFVKSPLAWVKVNAWAMRKDEFVRRAAFSLLATLAVHDKKAGDEAFIAALALVEAAADDNRNFVKKAVNWALRGIGKRNKVLRPQAIAAALRIQQQGSKPARWIAADALRELQPK
ncbi:MAG: DNA alkylation repair protein [Pseudomonadota bacterium]